MSFIKHTSIQELVSRLGSNRVATNSVTFSLSLSLRVFFSLGGVSGCSSLSGAFLPPLLFLSVCLWGVPLSPGETYVVRGGATSTSVRDHFTDLVSFLRCLRSRLNDFITSLNYTVRIVSYFRSCSRVQRKSSVTNYFVKDGSGKTSYGDVARTNLTTPKRSVQQGNY